MIVAGASVYGRDFPPSVSDQDWTTFSNINSTTYTAGTPEVGVNFIAPTSGRVFIAIGAGIRNNSAANADRGVVNYILYEDSSDGVVVAAANANNGVVSNGTALAEEFRYMGGFSMQEGLTPGKNYYAQVVHRSTIPSATVDITARDITVIPVP